MSPNSLIALVAGMVKPHSLLLRGVTRGNTYLENYIDGLQANFSDSDNPYLLKTSRILSYRVL